jgi:hypothetical protein
MHIKSWKENLQERDYLEDLVVGLRVILEWILEVGWVGMDCIHLDLCKGQCPSFVNMVLMFGFHKILIS